MALEDHLVLRSHLRTFPKKYYFQENQISAIEIRLSATHCIQCLPQMPIDDHANTTKRQGLVTSSNFQVTASAIFYQAEWGLKCPRSHALHGETFTSALTGVCWFTATDCAANTLTSSPASIRSSIPRWYCWQGSRRGYGRSKINLDVDDRTALPLSPTTGARDERPQYPETLEQQRKAPFVPGKQCRNMASRKRPSECPSDFE